MPSTVQVLLAVAGIALLLLLPIAFLIGLNTRQRRRERQSFGQLASSLRLEYVGTPKAIRKILNAFRHMRGIEPFPRPLGETTHLLRGAYQGHELIAAARLTDYRSTTRHWMSCAIIECKRPLPKFTIMPKHALFKRLTNEAQTRAASLTDAFVVRSEHPRLAEALIHSEFARLIMDHTVEETDVIKVEGLKPVKTAMPFRASLALESDGKHIAITLPHYERSIAEGIRHCISLAVEIAAAAEREFAGLANARHK